MTTRTGGIIEQVARVIDVEFDDYRPYYNADGLCVTSNAARALADAGLLRQEPPTRDEIARAMEEKHRVEPLGDADHHHGCVCGDWDDSWDCAETWDEHYADSVLALLEGRKR